MPHMSGNERLTGSVFMLPAYSTLRPCLPRLEDAVNAGREVWLVCSSAPMERFLQPLEKLGVHVFYAPTPRIRLFRPWNLFRERRRFLRTVEQLVSAIPPSDVYFYTICFDLAQMSIVSHFAGKPQFKLWFEDRDHTGPMGQQNQPCTAWRYRWYALEASWVIGTPVKMCYPPEPFPMLTRDALADRFTAVSPAPVSDIASQPWNILKPLVRNSPAEVLWLYEDYPAYYGPDRVPLDPYLALWRSMVLAVRKLFPEARQAVKAHPRMETLPDCFEGCETIAYFVPIEFVELPSVRLVVGAPSLGLQPFIGRKAVSTLCMIEMMQAPAEVLEVERQRLTAWVDPSNRVEQFRSLEEFARIATSALR